MMRSSACRGRTRWRCT